MGRVGVGFDRQHTSWIENIFDQVGNQQLTRQLTKVVRRDDRRHKLPKYAIVEKQGVRGHKRSILAMLVPSRELAHTDRDVLTTKLAEILDCPNPCSSMSASTGAVWMFRSPTRFNCLTKLMDMRDWHNG